MKNKNEYINKINKKIKQLQHRANKINNDISRYAFTCERERELLWQEYDTIKGKIKAYEQIKGLIIEQAL